MKTLVLLVLIVAASAPPAAAELRDTTVEVYGYTGSYRFGNRSNVLKGGEWNPQGGVGLFVPVGSRWAVLTDLVTSRLEVNEGPHGPLTDHPIPNFYKQNPDVRNEDVTTQSLAALLPSIIRLVPVYGRDRFSVYVGAGLGLEHQRQHIRYRPVHERPDGRLVRDEGFTDSRDSVWAYPVILRGGFLVGLTRRLALRGGYSHILGYFDAAASRSLEVGVGYRF